MDGAQRKVGTAKHAGVLDRVVELPGAIFQLHKAGANGCWMGRKRAFRNSRDYTATPKAHECTHVCKLCWPNRAEESDDDPWEGSLANSGDELAQPQSVPAISSDPPQDPALFLHPASYDYMGYA